MTNIHREHGLIECKEIYKAGKELKDKKLGACICMKCFKIFEPNLYIPTVFDFFLCPEHNPVYLNFEVS